MLSTVVDRCFPPCRWVPAPKNASTRATQCPPRHLCPHSSPPPSPTISLPMHLTVRSCPDRSSMAFFLAPGSNGVPPADGFLHPKCPTSCHPMSPTQPRPPLLASPVPYHQLAHASNCTLMPRSVEHGFFLGPWIQRRPSSRWVPAPKLPYLLPPNVPHATSAPTPRLSRPLPSACPCI